MSHLNFGQLKIGQKRSKKFTIINRSKQTINNCLLSFDHTLANKHLSIDPKPNEKFKLRRLERQTIVINFTPTVRLPPFDGNVLIHAQGLSQVLTHIRGACFGVGAKLETDTLSFGSVVLGSTKKMNVKLFNTGDVPTTFRWDTKSLKPHYSFRSLHLSTLALTPINTKLRSQPVTRQGTSSNGCT